MCSVEWPIAAETPSRRSTGSTPEEATRSSARSSTFTRSYGTRVRVEVGDDDRQQVAVELRESRWKLLLAETKHTPHAFVEALRNEVCGPLVRFLETAAFLSDLVAQRAKLGGDFVERARAVVDAAKFASNSAPRAVTSPSPRRCIGSV